MKSNTLICIYLLKKITFIIIKIPFIEIKDKKIEPLITTVTIFIYILSDFFLYLWNGDFNISVV